MMTLGITFEGVQPGFYRDELTWTEMPLPTEKEANDFLGAMHETDYQAGNWNEKLVELALISDVGNRRKLRRTFGGLVSAVILYKEHDQGFRMLWKIAGREDQMPSYLRCGRGVTVTMTADGGRCEEETCNRGLSCANLGLSPWTSEGCPDAP